MKREKVEIQAYWISADDESIASILLARYIRVRLTVGQLTVYAVAVQMISVIIVKKT